VAQREPEQLLADVGKQIGECRVRCGMTQQALADAVRCSLRYVQRVESGTANLTLHTLAKFSSALGVDAAHFLALPAVASPRAARNAALKPN
jgi:transcriptional regulator with XRE-family HTH domain